MRLRVLLGWLAFQLGATSAGNEEVGWLMPKPFEQLPGAAPTEAPLPAHGAALAAPHLETAGHAESHGVETAEELHEEEEAEEEPDGVTWTTALLLIGFLIIFVGILYLVNCTDEDIREAIWGMINTTVSIFCAATFDNAVFRFLHFQVVLSPPPRGLGLKHDTPQIKSAVGACFAIAVSVALHLLLFYVPKDDKQKLFSIRTIGGHVYAFASILTFGFLQETAFFRENIWMVLSVVGIAFAVMVLSYQFIMWAAKRRMGSKKWEDSRNQRVQMKEMQVDASAIAIGFLLCQVICYYLSEAENPEYRFIPILHGYPSEQKHHSVLYLCILAGVLLVSSAVWSIYLRPKDKRTKVLYCISNFVFNYIGVLLSCTGCWCLQRAGLIYLFHFFNQSKREELGRGMAANRAMIVNAFLMSFVAVIFVLAIDKIADHVEKTKKAASTSPKRILKRDDAEDSTLAQLGTLTGMDVENLPSLPRSISGLTEIVGGEELDRIEQGLRTVMIGFGLLVGICWDKAFETAHETVAEAVPVFHAHPVIGTGLVAAILLIFVLPAWYMYIVPNAMKSEDEHKADILHALEYEESLMKKQQSEKSLKEEVSASESSEADVSTSET